MVKFLFLDYRELETVEGLARELQQPTKHEGNPLFVADAPWEHGNMQLYGSVVKAPGKPFQMWYSEEIRCYYMGTTQRHQVHWELEPQAAGLGLATLKPDRFIALRAGDQAAELLTMAFAPPSPRLFVNAATGRGGWLRVEVLDVEGHPIPGYQADACEPIGGDSLAHEARWSGADPAAFPAQQPTRLRVRAQNASLFSIFVTHPGEAPDPRRFRAARP